MVGVGVVGLFEGNGKDKNIKGEKYVAIACRCILYALFMFQCSKLVLL